MSDVSPEHLRYEATLRGAYWPRLPKALLAAADEIEKLRAAHREHIEGAAGVIEFLGKHATEQAAEIERLRAALTEAFDLLEHGRSEFIGGSQAAEHWRDRRDKLLNPEQELTEG